VPKNKNKKTQEEIDYFSTLVSKQYFGNGVLIMRNPSPKTFLDNTFTSKYYNINP